MTPNDIITGAVVSKKTAYNRAWRAANADKVRAASSRWRESNKEKVRAYERSRVRVYSDAAKERRRAYALANRDKAIERSKVWRMENLDRARALERKSKGLPLPTRPEPSNCECCGGPPGKKSLGVDHCHESGQFRGWLCTNCNTGIGKLGDGIDGLMRAVAYLEMATKRGSHDA